MTDMACDHARMLLSHQLDGGLNALETANLERHLGRCPACLAVAEDFWRQDRQLAEMHSAALVDEFAQQIRWKLRRSRTRGARWATAVAALAAAVVLATFGFRRAWQPGTIDKPPAAPANGQLVQVQSGDVLVDGVPAETFGDGSSVQVVGERPAVVRLVDGSEAQFEPGTTAIVHGRRAGVREWIELDEGAGTFRVEKAHGQFQVTTELGRVTALGTEFSVGLRPSTNLGDLTMRMRNALLAVAVLSGVVQVEYNGQTFVLGGGESRVFGDEPQAPAAGRRDNVVPPAGPAAGRGAGRAAGQRGERGPSSAVRGIIESVSTGKITLTTRRTSAEYAVSPDATVTIDGKPAKLDDLAAGMLVLLDRKQEGDPVSAIKAEGPTIFGEVKSVDAGAHSITITPPPGRQPKPDETYAVADDATVILEGRKPAKLSEVNAGLQVSLRLSVDKKLVLQINRVQPHEPGTGRRGEAAPPAAPAPPAVPAPPAAPTAPIPPAGPAAPVAPAAPARGR